MSKERIYDLVECKWIISKPYREVISRIFREQDFKFNIETDVKYIKMFNIPYNFSKFFEANSGKMTDEFYNI